MVWKTPKLDRLMAKAKLLVAKKFNMSTSELNVPIFIADKEELYQALLYESQHLDYTKEEIRAIRQSLHLVIGKYFRFKKEIWVLVGKGINVDTIIHEIIHSIQECRPNREGIVYYITYKITGNLKHINPFELKDWQEIEKTTSYSKIKQRLLTAGDCEDF